MKNANITLKCTDGIIYKGFLKTSTTETFILTDLQYQTVGSDYYVPNLKQSGTYYTGEVKFYKKNIIWYSKQG